MRLLCIDFANLVIRHAANPYGEAVDHRGLSAHGAVGALGQVLRTITEQSPTHLLLARDCSRADNFRAAIDPGYKAHRPEADEDLRRQFELAGAGVSILRLPEIRLPRHEADDIMASAARSFPGPVRILTGDKDLLALCSERVAVLLLRPGGEVIVDINNVEDVIGVRADQLRDYKALCGDKSDGIPGIRGIGPKSAKALLERYQNLQQVYAALDSDEKLEGVTERVAQLLRQGRAEAQLSWRLAGLVDDLEIDIEALRCPEIPDDYRIGAKLERAGLSGLRSRLKGFRRPAQRQQFLDLEAAFDALGQQNDP